MKTIMMISIDTEIKLKAKDAYPNVSKKIEDLLRASLEIPEEIVEREQQKRLEQLNNKKRALETSLLDISKEKKKIGKELEVKQLEELARKSRTVTLE